MSGTLAPGNTSRRREARSPGREAAPQRSVCCPPYLDGEIVSLTQRNINTIGWPGLICVGLARVPQQVFQAQPHLRWTSCPFNTTHSLITMSLPIPQTGHLGFGQTGHYCFGATIFDVRFDISQVMCQHFRRHFLREADVDSLGKCWFIRNVLIAGKPAPTRSRGCGSGLAREPNRSVLPLAIDHAEWLNRIQNSVQTH